jgi:hypothetical protein
MITKFLFLVTMVLVIGLFGIVYGHTVDSVGEYRLEIGWMNEPVVSGETNGIELFVSTMEPGLPLEEQKFQKGITGLEETLKMQLVFRDQKIMLPFSADHNIPGKYYAFVDPTISGYYQANILGKIGDTNVSLSMHPPKVENRTHIEFPLKESSTEKQILEEYSILQQQIDENKELLNKIESATQATKVGYVGMVLGAAGIIIASIAISKSKK